jgi:hypothetical protein
MKGIIQGGAVLLVAGALVLGGSGLAGAAAQKPKQESTATYTKTLCGVYSQLATDGNGYVTALGTLDQGNPATFVPAATTQTNALLTTVKNAEATLKGVYPNISNGKKVGALLATRPAQIDSFLTSALSQLQTGGIAGVTQFVVGISTLQVKLSDPFSKVTDQGLINAFQKEKSCKSIVQVTG